MFQAYLMIYKYYDILQSREVELKNDDYIISRDRFAIIFMD
jgi:hypothetical protein